MEQNFQTSFIPKRPMIEERVSTPRPVGLFLVASLFIFFTVLIGSGGLYFYRGVMTKSITKMQNDLELAKNRFEPSKINQLQVLDKRLKASTEILDKHVAVSPIFESLGAITMKTVRFTKFEYSFVEDKTTEILVKMSGLAVGYRSVALQSDLMAGNKYFLDPVFSNLTLDNNGNVLFDLEFRVDPTFLDYKSVLLRADEDIITAPAPETPIVPTTPNTPVN